MPKTPTQVLALALFVTGLALRIYHYYFLQQYLLKLLIVVTVVIFVRSLVANLSSRTFLDPFILVLVAGILCCLTYESAASNKAKNQEYLERLARIINRYTEKNHRAPGIFDDALGASWEMVPNRGDADGNNYSYLQIGDRAFVLKTLGANQKNDSGADDDVQLNYLNGNSVTLEELSNWIEQNGTPDEKMALEAYWPALRRDW